MPITGTFPPALCDVQYCSAKFGTNLVAPCGTTNCCDLGNGAACNSETTPAPTCAAVLKLSESECPEGKKGKNLGGAGRGLYSVDECGEAAALQQGCDHIQWSDYSNTNGVGWGCLCCDVESGESLQGRANIYYSLYDVTCYGSGGGDSPAATPAPAPAPICDDASYVQIFDQCYDPEETTYLRVPSASPTPGAPRDRPSTSQGPRLYLDHRPDPARDRPAHEAEKPASSPRVPDARRAARPPLGVAGTSATTRSPARSRPRSACSRS